MSQVRSPDSPDSHSYYTGRFYALCFGALIVLTLASFGCSYLELGKAEVFVALGIAVLKVCIVALYFMHLAKEPPSHRLAAIAAVIFVAILAALASADIMTRG